MYAEFLYEWLNANHLPRRERRSIFSVNLPHGQADESKMRLVLDSPQFFSLLGIIKSVALAPQLVREGGETLLLSLLKFVAEMVFLVWPRVPARGSKCRAAISVVSPCHGVVFGFVSARRE